MVSLYQNLDSSGYNSLHCVVHIADPKKRRQQWEIRAAEDWEEEEEEENEPDQEEVHSDTDKRNRISRMNENLLGKSMPEFPSSFLRNRPSPSFESIYREPTVDYIPPDVREGEEFDLTLEGGIIAFKRAPIDEGSLERE